jgi:hypothetical protein
VAQVVTESFLSDAIMNPAGNFMTAFAEMVGAKVNCVLARRISPCEKDVKNCDSNYLIRRVVTIEQSDYSP